MLVKDVLQIDAIMGLCARGGFTVDMKWKTGRLERAVISSKTGGHCKVRYKDILTEIYVPAGGGVALDGKLKQISK
ncbi:glycoside hydrolase family 95-like protein [Anaerocolumna jejuensis]|uniref:glycoside hydrolase family 95-like protein n=1 Tax=Anaerocolumna jejuensis TaxID=259063 RepID=UPI0009332882|nr:hypothetical protein [Anaerocolumna jejuensis]